VNRPATSPACDIDALVAERLAALKPLRVELIDDSALHAGHAGAKDGGHYRLLIVAAEFSGKSTVLRHRLVYEAMGDLMRSRIHALSIRALTPEEAAGLPA
jgi:BolA family transcriptional regulator, general stress-responsive regulator